MKIGIIGSGNVGKTLAAGFIKHGHKVTLGTRSPEKLSDWGRTVPGVSIGSFAEAAAFAELAVLAVKGSAAEEALSAAGVFYLADKPVIDVTNPITDDLPESGVLRFFTTLDESLMERLQNKFQKLCFVKAFNSVGSATMVNPEFADGKPSMFICGDNEDAKKTVGILVNQLGWEVEDMGNAVAARAIEPLCMLWCIPGFLRNDWSHAFKLLK